MLVFTLRVCRWDTIKSHAFPVVKFNNCLVGFARLSRVYEKAFARLTGGPGTGPRSTMEHCGLSPANVESKPDIYKLHIVIYRLYTFTWKIWSAQRAHEIRMEYLQTKFKGC